MVSLVPAALSAAGINHAAGKRKENRTQPEGKSSPAAPRHDEMELWSSWTPPSPLGSQWRERLEHGLAAAWHAQPQPTACSEDTVVMAPWRGWWPASSRGVWWIAASHSDCAGCLCCWLFGSAVPLTAWAGPRSTGAVCSRQTQRAVMLWSRVKWFLLLFIPEAFCCLVSLRELQLQASPSAGLISCILPCCSAATSLASWESHNTGEATTGITSSCHNVWCRFHNSALSKCIGCCWDSPWTAPVRNTDSKWKRRGP